MAGPLMPPSPRGGCCYVDRAAAEAALAMALPMIESALQKDQVGSLGFLCIVILDPGVSPEQAEFEEAVLLEHAMGGRESWDADYAAFARAKARLSWSLRCDGARVQAERPHLLRAGDSLVAGSVWLDGLTVAVSGAYPWFDEAFALAIAGCLRAQAKASQARALAGHASIVAASPAQPVLTRL